MDRENSILIASPTYEGKAYSFGRWLHAIRHITYPRAHVLVVDNSPTLDFYQTWSKQVPMAWLPTEGTPNQRIAESMEFIRQWFLKCEWDYWLNVESDILVEPYILDFMLAHARGVDWLNLPYPARGRNEILEHSFGCALFSRHLMEQVDFKGAPADQTTDGWFLNKVQGKFSIKVLRSAITPVHLAE